MMDYSTFWWLLGLISILVEILTGAAMSFFLLTLAASFFIGAVAAHLGLGIESQLMWVAVSALVFLKLWHVYLRKTTEVTAHESNPAVNLDVGAVVFVDHWDGQVGSTSYRGSRWRVRLSKEFLNSMDGLHRVISVEGNTLVVKPLAVD